MAQESEEGLFDGQDESDDLEQMREQLKKLEEEKFNEIKDAAVAPNSKGGVEDGPEADARSIYIGNVDYSCTPDDLQELFKGCGAINRITIMCDKMTGQPKGFAYLEFADAESVAASLLLNNQELKGRALKIVSKRTNKPLVRGARGRGARGRGRGGYGPMFGMPPPYGYYPPPMPYGYPPARGMRGNRRAKYNPY